jgi:hypothetical protein
MCVHIRDALRREFRTILSGTVVVAANQSGNFNYSVAPQVTQAMVVNKATATVLCVASQSESTHPLKPTPSSALG